MLTTIAAAVQLTRSFATIRRLPCSRARGAEDDHPTGRCQAHFQRLTRAFVSQTWRVRNDHVRSKFLQAGRSSYIPGGLALLIDRRPCGGGPHAPARQGQRTPAPPLSSVRVRWGGCLLCISHGFLRQLTKMVAITGKIVRAVGH